ncbi:MAG: hypothetical protein H0T83_06625 [Chthoniobacterales bacterium]|nr:hypothetical protein [Chthoniobacterales bacterium]
MVERDFGKAKKLLQECPDGEDKTYQLGYTALARGNLTTARRQFEALRPVFEARVRDHPDDSSKEAS